MCLFVFLVSVQVVCISPSYLFSSYDTSFWRLANLQIHDEPSAQNGTHRSPFIFIASRSRRLFIQPARRSPPSFIFSPATPLPLVHTYFVLPSNHQAQITMAKRKRSRKPPGKSSPGKKPRVNRAQRSGSVSSSDSSDESIQAMMMLLQPVQDPAEKAPRSPRLRDRV